MFAMFLPFRKVFGPAPVPSQSWAGTIRFQAMPAIATPLELEQHRPYLLRFALLQLRDRSAAEDAVQEALLAAIQGASQFAGQSSVRTWLVGILKHKIIDAIRRSSRERPVESRDESAEDLDALFTDDGHFADVPQEWASPN